MWNTFSSWEVIALKTYNFDKGNEKYTETLHVMDGDLELVHRQLNIKWQEWMLKWVIKWWLGHEGRKCWQLQWEMPETRSYHSNLDLPAIRQCTRQQIPDSSLPVEISSLHYKWQGVNSNQDVPELKGTFFGTVAVQIVQELKQLFVQLFDYQLFNLQFKSTM